jgi:catechol 2,3-dioxygenase-like lactoylglutathione lyase family enzyme
VLIVVGKLGQQWTASVSGEKAMSRVTLIQHINIQISNRERTREWYEKVLGAEFLDRGPELNKRQLQLRIGSGEIHTTHTPNPAPSGHFAVEITDWDEMIANLDRLGVPYNTRSRDDTGESGSKYGRREYSGGYSTYIQDPDGNTIELVHHPLGVEDSEGKKVELPHDPKSLKWSLRPGFGPSA